MSYSGYKLSLCLYRPNNIHNKKILKINLTDDIIDFLKKSIIFDNIVIDNRDSPTV